MHLYKVACLATALLCLVYTGVCTELDDGYKRVRDEVVPKTYKIDNDCAVGSNILGGITAVTWDISAVSCNAQAAFYALAHIYLEIYDVIEAALTGTAAAEICLKGKRDQIVRTAANAGIDFVNGIIPIVSLIPGQQAQIQGIVTRRNAPTIVNIYFDLKDLVSQYPTGGLAAAINAAIDAVISLLADIADGLLVILDQAVHTALSITACVVKVTLAVIETIVGVVSSAVTCATNNNVTVTPPVLPPSPENITAIVIKGLADFAAYGNPTAVVAKAIANAVYLVKLLADEITAVTANIITDAIHIGVKALLDKLTALKATYFWHFFLVAELQAAIDKIVVIKINAFSAAAKLFYQLSQHVAFLKQQSVDLEDELKRLVRNKGTAAIIACGHNIIDCTPAYVHVCIDALLKNFLRVIERITSDIDVIIIARDELHKVFQVALSGHVAFSGSLSLKVFNDCVSSVYIKFGIKIA